MVISTWMYTESSGEESHYPQVGGRSSSETFQEVYWRCIAAFFATSVRNNPDARHLLATNATTMPVVDGVDLSALLSRLEVDVVKVPYTYRPPADYFESWGSQFYVFDVLKHLAADTAIEADESCLVLDSDCVWIADGTAMDGAIRQHGALPYALDEHPQANINGLTRTDMRALYSAFLDYQVPTPIYCGGEIVAATGSTCRLLAEEADALWRRQIQRHEAGKMKFNEEAHMLSFLYCKLGYPIGTANPFIKRIWTNLPFRYHTDVPNDYGLTIWHLPMEKRWGFGRLFSEVVDPSSTFWQIEPGAPMAEYLGGVFGVDRTSVIKIVRDAAELVARIGSRVR